MGSGGAEEASEFFSCRNLEREKGFWGDVLGGGGLLLGGGSEKIALGCGHDGGL